MLFLGIKKIPLKEKYAFIVLEIFDFNRGDIHRGICAINWAESHGIKSHGTALSANMAEWRRNIRGELPVYGHIFNSFCGPDSLLPYLELHSRLHCSLKCMKAELQKRKL